MKKLKSFLLGLALISAAVTTRAGSLPDVGGVHYDQNTYGNWPEYCQSGCTAYSYWPMFRNWMRPLENIHVVVTLVNGSYLLGSNYSGVLGSILVQDTNATQVVYSYYDSFSGQVYDPYPTLHNEYITRVEFDLDANVQYWMDVTIYNFSFVAADTEITINTTSR